MPELCCADSANRITVVAVGVDPDDGDRVEAVECRARTAWVDAGRPENAAIYHTRLQRAASMIRSVTMSGGEVIATWEESTSRVSASLRWAVKRWARLLPPDGMVFPCPNSPGLDSPLRTRTPPPFPSPPPPPPVRVGEVPQQIAGWL